MKRKLLVCVHQRLTEAEASCGGRGGEALMARLESAVAERGLDAAVEPVHCFSRCQKGPVVRVAPGGAFFEGAGEGDLAEILDELQRMD